MEAKQAEHIQFHIHDELHTVRVADIDPHTTLNKYLRNVMHLTGTKYMCKQGGCGSCIVGVTFKHPVTKKEVTLAVNSCLIPLIICQSWKISTVEGIGNKKNGFHKIQQTLAKFNGTQCGFCSGGMVMNMYTLLKENNNSVTMKEMENSFGGNLCRCTGYRPILTAFKTLCSDADKSLIGTYPAVDIEDLKICKNGGECQNTCTEPCSVNQLTYWNVGSSKWYKAFSVKEIFEIWAANKTDTYMLVCGNTAQGVYPIENLFDLYIDITSIPELRKTQIENNILTLGANMTLTNTMATFKSTASQYPLFTYLNKLVTHIDLVANVPVRNFGSLAGNLCIKNQHNEFPSDIFVLLVAVDAKLSIALNASVEQSMMEYLSSFVYSYEDSLKVIPAEDFLNYDMKRKVLVNIQFPSYDGSYKFESYKIMPRAQNAHAMVNAAFLFKMDGNIVKSARMVYGNISPKFVRAKKTEAYLVGKNLFNNGTLQAAFNILDNEVQPNIDPPNPSPAYRKSLSVALFYKFVLSIAPNNVITDIHKSGKDKLSRPISKGAQTYTENKSMYPLYNGINKLEALAQTSGAAEYINDIPDRPNQLYAAFVLANAPAKSEITSVDTTQAMKLPGVVGYFDKDSIPGENNFFPASVAGGVVERIFCEKTVEHFHQPVGMIVAKNEETANKAAKMVKVNFKKAAMDPFLTIGQILDSKNADVINEKIHNQDKDHNRTRTGNSNATKVTGKFYIDAQHHFHMETHICNVIPIEDDGFDIHTSTQWMDHVQASVANALKIQANKINISVRRVGGAYGAKIARSSLPATACAVAAQKLQKPVKMNMSLEDNLRIIGGRIPFYVSYEASIDAAGAMQKLDAKLYSDYSTGGNEPVADFPWMSFSDPYNIDTWQVSEYLAYTDNPAYSYCRAPGTTEGSAAIESIMEHLAIESGINGVAMRLANFNNNHALLRTLFAEFQTWADINNRTAAVEVFNTKNRWMKKGIAVVPTCYNLIFYGTWNVLVSINHHDGTVSVSHGGIEVGQGINTKVAQTCAHALGITIDKISVKPSNNLVSDNAMMTAGSLTSESVCFAAMEACNELNKTLNATRADMPSGASWEEVVQKTYTSEKNLSACYMYNKEKAKVSSYYIYCVCATEVLVDILTGNHLVTRVDLVEDTGDSLNPFIDIGQVEGAFIMGMGYYTSEKLVRSRDGRMLTDSTWTYKVPGAKDIPIDFRVKFPPNIGNEHGVLKTKATAEPPLNLSVSVPLAIRHAIASARKDSNSNGAKWVEMDGPTTPEVVFMSSLNLYRDFTL